MSVKSISQNTVYPKPGMSQEAAATTEAREFKFTSRRSVTGECISQRWRGKGL